MLFGNYFLPHFLSSHHFWYSQLLNAHLFLLCQWHSLMVSVVQIELYLFEVESELDFAEVVESVGILKRFVDVRVLEDFWTVVGIAQEVV